jgi:hypothetical protein
VLPGHGNRAQATPAEWTRQLGELVAEMGRETTDTHW